jgi:hypothetical protein
MGRSVESSGTTVMSVTRAQRGKRRRFGTWISLVDIAATNARNRGNVGDVGSPVINGESRMLKRFKPQSRATGMLPALSELNPVHGHWVSTAAEVGEALLKSCWQKRVRKAIRAANRVRSERAENGEISFAGRSESNDAGRPSSSGTFATRDRTWMPINLTSIRTVEDPGS